MPRARQRRAAGGADVLNGRWLDDRGIGAMDRLAIFCTAVQLSSPSSMPRRLYGNVCTGVDRGRLDRPGLCGSVASGVAID